MQQITVYTLFDITKTGVVRRFKPEILPVTKKGLSLSTEQDYNFARKQQSNYEVLIQTLSLRTQVHDITNSQVVNESVSKYNFDKSYKGKHNIWSFSYSVEHTDALERNGNPIGVLLEDCHNLPMLTDLNETITDKYIDCENPNIYFVLN